MKSSFLARRQEICSRGICKGMRIKPCRFSKFIQTWTNSKSLLPSWFSHCVWLRYAEKHESFRTDGGNFFHILIVFSVTILIEFFCKPSLHIKRVFLNDQIVFLLLPSSNSKNVNSIILISVYSISSRSYADEYNRLRSRGS